MQSCGGLGRSGIGSVRVGAQVKSGWGRPGEEGARQESGVHSSFILLSTGMLWLGASWYLSSSDCARPMHLYFYYSGFFFRLQAASVARGCLTRWRLRLVWCGDDDAPPSCPHHASVRSTSHGTACCATGRPAPASRESLRERQSAGTRVWGAAEAVWGADGDALVAGRHQAERRGACSVFSGRPSGASGSCRGPLRPRRICLPLRPEDFERRASDGAMYLATRYAFYRWQEVSMYASSRS